MTSSIDKKALVAITKIGDLVAEEIRKRAKTTRMKTAISLSESRKLSGGNYYIDIIIDLKKAPEFMAYEKGSGIHGEKGETYIIKPKEAKALAFPFTLHWMPREAKYLGGYVDGAYYVDHGGTEGEFFMRDVGEINLSPSFWRYVDHPGVRAEPAVVPAFESKRNDAKEIFMREVGTAITLALKEVTKSNVKHS